MKIILTHVEFENYINIGNENEYVISYLPQDINAVEAVPFTNVNVSLIDGMDHCGSYCNSNHETLQIYSIYDYDCSFKTWCNVDFDFIRNNDSNVWYCNWLPSRQTAYLVMDVIKQSIQQSTVRYYQ